MFAGLIGAACSSNAEGDEPPPPPSQLEVETGVPWNVDIEPTLRTLSFAEPRRLGSGPLVLIDGRTPTEAAFVFFQAHATAFALQAPREDLTPEAEGTDALGLRYASFTQKSESPDAPSAMRIAVHFDDVGRISFVAGRYNATRTVDADAGASSSSSSTTQKDIRLLSRRPPPCLRIEGSGHGVHYYAKPPSLHDAADVKRFEVTPSATTSGTYEMRRDGLRCENGEGVVTSTKLDDWDSTGDVPGAAVDAYFHGAKVMEFYLTVLGRKSYDDKNGPLALYVNQIPVGGEWTTGSISFGPPSPDRPSPALSYAGAFDAIAHEFQHGVTETTLRFADSTQGLREGIHSDILNESFSDIFAAFAEHWYRPGPGNTTLAEDVAAPGYPPTRDLGHPSLCLNVACTDDCAHRACPDHFSKLDVEADPHRSTGISSNAWFLMTLGGTNDTSHGAVDDPLGWDASLRLWYALVVSRAIAPSARFRDVALTSVALARHTPEGGAGRAAACAWVAVGVLESDLVKRFWGFQC